MKTQMIAVTVAASVALGSCATGGSSVFDDLEDLNQKGPRKRAPSQIDVDFELLPPLDLGWIFGGDRE
jgi:hypothetical protein